MFDAKKLLDALGTPAAPSAEPATPPTAPKPAEAPKPAAASPLGAGSLLSDLIDLANRPSPPPSQSSNGDPQPAAPKPEKAAAPPPSDLTDLLLRRAQDYLKTPQGNAAVHAVMAGVTKAVVNSQTGRKLTEKAKAKGVALLGRFMNKGEETGPLLEAQALPKPADPPALPSPTIGTPALPPVPAASESENTALLVLRAMIAAAAADGRIDEDERERILGTLKNAGIDGEGVHLVEAELARPATAAELAAAVKTREAAIQVYTAARRIITPNTVEERVFLAHLSGALGLDPRLVAQIDAAASGVAPG
ncbi:tellurite resistance TerB family protein [Microvirga puerhi]|uniref:Tellurite resistance TerB family protein n=1 Tax=Microvirga puerhi TaxID=2876078 RepID=A0ABS7VPT0_9HYPH|nr:DUF533 domain-containing protein [Microvirga puerhi]MBZ6077534.1 tellurite resistance TerB family protein [Microvirga puerhi]